MFNYDCDKGRNQLIFSGEVKWL